jgi:hypothetical protein
MTTVVSDRPILFFVRTSMVFVWLVLGMARAAPAQDAAPGNIRLLPGYRHESTASLDTRTGRIWKDGGPRITYEIGPLSTDVIALNRERRRTADWSMTQQIGGASLELEMTDEHTMIAAYEGYFANFVIRGITSKTDMAEVMLMLMTYEPMEGLKRR